MGGDIYCTVAKGEQLGRRMCLLGYAGPLLMLACAMWSATTESLVVLLNAGGLTAIPGGQLCDKPWSGGESSASDAL